MSEMWLIMCVSAGCVCKPGFLLSGDECVSRDACGCASNGRYYKVIDIFLVQVFFGN